MTKGASPGGMLVRPFGHSEFGIRISGLPPGFTLIEMVLVIALTAILATAVTLSLTGPRRAAQARDVAEGVAHYDRLAREWSRRFGRPTRLTFHLNRGMVSRAVADGEAAGAEEDSAVDRPAALQLAGGYRIDRVVLAGRSASAGEVSVPCSTGGQTPSYAVLLAGPGGQRQWLVVAGLSGNVLTVNDEREVEDIFAALSGEPGADGRDDAP